MEPFVLDLTPGINILQGANGLGKTNIVEAIEVLSTGLSHRTSSSVPLVQRGEHAATIRANIESVTDPEPADDGVNTSADAVDISDMKPVRQTQTTTLEATIAARGANRARINGGQSRYLREILGTLPTVSFTPEDQQLVAGDPAVRRSFINQVASLLIPGYANRLQSFTHVAKQRAALLKQLGQWQRAGSPIDAALSGLEIWTGQFIEAGVALSRDRQRIIAELNKSFGPLYARLAGVAGDLPSNAEIQDTAQNGGEQAAVEYVPSFDEILGTQAPEPLISQHFQRIYPGEVSRGVNLIGPQRDDLLVTLNGMPAREFASNGEMWTLALALKMAQYRALCEYFDTRPVVILDDVFAQLDESRRTEILHFAAAQDQVLITAASGKRYSDTAGERVGRIRRDTGEPHRSGRSQTARRSGCREGRRTMTEPRKPNTPSGPGHRAGPTSRAARSSRAMYTIRTSRFARPCISTSANCPPRCSSTSPRWREEGVSG